MVNATLFSHAHLAELKKALTVYSRRHRIIADNIANVETPGYRAQELRFEEYLRTAGNQLHGGQTHPGHLRIGGGSLSETQGKVLPRLDDYDNGLNNVDVDREMSDLVTNDLAYRLATRLLSMKYNLLRGAITGRVR
jgi:flagellar basal-body rod protein FlgB